MKTLTLLSLSTSLALALSLTGLFAFGETAHATSFPVKNGRMDFNLSGGTGDNAGSVSLNLAYTDATKTAVHVTGSGRDGGKAFSVDETATLAALKQINIYAAGGDGYSGDDGRNGEDGQNGQDGSNGWNGSDGCPPSSGQNGTDGSAGQDGGNGEDGTNGGNGGSGGVVNVTSSADQSELMLLVHWTVDAGSGGRGGSGGRAGSGGRGGNGGSGGSGGRNNCVDGQGKPTGGADGSNGWNGNSGRSGSDGRAGSDGYNGSDGRQGSFAMVTTDASGSHTYAKPFHLTINSVKALDDNEDTVVEPGEQVHITEITIANTGPMPTPAGAALALALANSPTITLKNAPTVNITDVIPGNSTKTLTFAKGAMVMVAPDDAKLVGKDVTLTSSIGINAFSIPNSDPVGLSIHWPVGVSAAAASASTYFGTAKAITYTLKNVTTKDVGPSGEQPVEVSFDWVSKDVPGADVTAVLKDGRQFTMDRTYVVNDFTIPAKGTLSVPVTLTVKNSKSLLSDQGTLKVTLKLKDESGNAEDQVDSSTTALGLVADFRPVAISRKIDISAMKIYCKFPHRLLQTLLVSELDLTKKAGSDTLTMQIARKGFLSDGTSPAHTLGTFDFGPYGSLAKSASPSVVAAFLNKLYAPASAKDEATWVMQGGTCAVQQQ